MFYYCFGIQKRIQKKWNIKPHAQRRFCLVPTPPDKSGSTLTKPLPDEGTLSNIMWSYTIFCNRLLSCWDNKNNISHIILNSHWHTAQANQATALYRWKIGTQRFCFTCATAFKPSHYNASCSSNKNKTLAEKANQFYFNSSYTPQIK